MLVSTLLVGEALIRDMMHRYWMSNEKLNVLRYDFAVGNLAFPLLLVGGLFLLSRRSQGGPGGPGGNNPLAFGKSKAKFQMEPNTGITFDDVAGVDEAKQDFMEVSLFTEYDTQCTALLCLWA